MGWLRGQPADAGRPVGERGTHTGPVTRATTRPQQVVACAACKERAAPIVVVTGAGNVLAGDPDRVAVDCRRAVVAPARADRVREALLPEACKAVVRGDAVAA